MQEILVLILWSTTMYIDTWRPKYIWMNERTNENINSNGKISRYYRKKSHKSCTNHQGIISLILKNTSYYSSQIYTQRRLSNFEVNGVCFCLVWSNRRNYGFAKHSVYIFHLLNNLLPFMSGINHFWYSGQYSSNDQQNWIASFWCILVGRWHLQQLTPPGVSSLVIFHKFWNFEYQTSVYASVSK